MNDYTNIPPNEPGYYIYINRYTYLVEVLNLGLSLNDKEELKLYNFGAHENHWGPDRGWLWNKEGLYKKIEIPSDPKGLIKEYYNED